MGNTFGKIFRITTWGESHGPAIGVVIDGCPAGVVINEKVIEKELARDIPDPEIGSQRKEPNQFEILSGVFEGITLGTPLSICVKNQNVESISYEERKLTPRPGHADFTYKARYHYIDWRGGSRASGRECIGRILGGAIAKQMLDVCGIEVFSFITELAGIKIENQKDLEKARNKVIQIGKEGDSTGGIIKIIIKNPPPGVGSPVFDKLEAILASALMSIGGVRSFEIGEGKALAGSVGSMSNDGFIMENNKIRTLTNKSGGVLGGISTGMNIEMVVSVKPTPSISKPQKTVDIETGEEKEIGLKGRFDYNFTPRMCVIAESMVSIVMVDYLIEGGFIHPTRFNESPILVCV